jgi:hypothetical protein
VCGGVLGEVIDSRRRRRRRKRRRRRRKRRRKDYSMQTQ